MRRYVLMVVCGVDGVLIPYGHPEDYGLSATRSCLRMWGTTAQAGDQPAWFNLARRLPCTRCVHICTVPLGPGCLAGMRGHRIQDRRLRRTYTVDERRAWTTPLVCSFYVRCTSYPELIRMNPHAHRSMRASQAKPHRSRHPFEARWFVEGTGSQSLPHRMPA